MPSVLTVSWCLIWRRYTTVISPLMTSWARPVSPWVNWRWTSECFCESIMENTEKYSLECALLMCSLQYNLILDFRGHYWHWYNIFYSLNYGFAKRDCELELQVENKHVSALWWTNYVDTLKNFLKHIFGISLLQFLVTYCPKFITLTNLLLKHSCSFGVYEVIIRSRLV